VVAGCRAAEGFQTESMPVRRELLLTDNLGLFPDQDIYTCRWYIESIPLAGEKRLSTSGLGSKILQNM